MARSDLMPHGRVLLTGATGMLGTAFQERLAGGELICLGRDDLDITRPAELRMNLQKLGPRVIINCAADTDVEGAEANPDKAYAVNAVLPELLAGACRELDARFVHFSSTGCYGHTKSTPYDDYDELVPPTAHHRAKAAAEAAVRESGAKSLILRLGWLYGGSKTARKNFVWQRIQEARRSPDLVSDPYQIGVPTMVDEVVTQTLTLLEAGLTGTFNCVAGGSVSRFDYVYRIVTLAGLSPRMFPRRFARKAAVSPNEAAINRKLSLMGLNLMSDWDAGLSQYVERLLRTDNRD